VATRYRTPTGPLADRNHANDRTRNGAKNGSRVVRRGAGEGGPYRARAPRLLARGVDVYHDRRWSEHAVTRPRPGAPQDDTVKN
jgi:hypothetical protein